MQRRQPPPRPFAAARDTPPRTLASTSLKQIEERGKEAEVGGKLLHLAKELKRLKRELGAEAKVLVTPPSNVGVRTRFVAGLRELIGDGSIADLNVKGKDDRLMQEQKCARPAVARACVRDAVSRTPHALPPARPQVQRRLRQVLAVPEVRSGA